MAVPAEDRGVLYIATGERYLDAAIRAATGVRRHCPNLPIALATDRQDIAPRDLFSHVQPIESGHSRSKVDCLIHSPFEKTLYLDTDARLVDDVTDMFRLLDRFDIALAHAHARNRRKTRQSWRAELPDCFPQLNGGVILYRKNEEVLRFLQEWSRSYHEAGFRKDQVTLRELLWTSTLRLYVLPPEFNVRYLRQAYFWNGEEARPRILHLRRFHDSGGSRKAVALARAREARDDFGAAFRALGGALKELAFLGGRNAA
jgi:hypothetical protein